MESSGTEQNTILCNFLTFFNVVYRTKTYKILQKSIKKKSSKIVPEIYSYKKIYCYKKDV